MLKRYSPLMLGPVCLTIMAACADDSIRNSSGFGTEASGVAPAGSDALIVSNTIPAMVAAGDVVTAQVVVQNIGSVDWNSTSWMLHMVGTYYGWVATTVPSGTTISHNQSITFTITARIPAGAASGHFRAQMMVNQGGVGGFFGQVLDVPISVGGTPAFAASFPSNTIPTTVAPGDIVNATVTALNTGTSSWNSPSFMLHVVPSDPNYYGFTASALPSGASVPQGGTFVFPVHFQVPASATTGHFQVQMLQNGSGGAFFGNVLDVSVAVGGSAQYADSFVSNTVPGTMTAGQIVHAQVVVRNEGTGTWDSTVQLRAVGSNGYGFTSLAIANGVTVAPTATTAFNLSFKVPAAATSGTFQVQMFLGGSGGGAFGPVLSVPVTISSAAAVCGPVYYPNPPAAPAAPTVLGTFGTELERLAFDTSGNIYATDFTAGTVHRWNGTSASTWLSGLNDPVGLVLDGAGNVIISEDGVSSATRYPVVGGAPGTPSVLQTVAPFGIFAVACDPSGNILTAQLSGTVDIIAPGGGVTTTPIAGVRPVDVRFDQTGKIYVSDVGADRVVVYSPTYTQLRSIALPSWPQGIALDNAGNIYVLTPATASVLKIAPDDSISTFISGIAVDTTHYPHGLMFDAAGDLYLTNAGSLVRYDAH